MRRLLSLTVALVCVGGGATRSTSAQTAQQSAPTGTMHVYPASDMEWKDGPGSLPAGAKFAVLEGDPAKEGAFTMRLQLPDGFRIPPHFHTGVEHVTVISGTFNVGMGEKLDPATATKMPAGTFGYWPAGMRHFAFTEGPTTLQLHGQGPWTITYVNPADDPRAKK